MPRLAPVSRGEEISFALFDLKDGAPAVTKTLQECLAKAMANGKQPRLVLNGMPLGAGASLVNTQDWFTGVITFELRTALPSGLSVPELAVVANYWTSVYREAGWNGVAMQRAEIQLDDVGTIARAKEIVRVSGSSEQRRTVATVTAFVIVILFLWALFSNEIFRDKAPAWIEKARSLVCVRNSKEAWQKWLEDQATTLGISSPELQQQARNAYERLRCDASVPTDRDAQLASTGALLDGKALPRVSYSLSRVQVGAWLITTIVGGLVIWIFHGQLPIIPLTFLALLGISGGTRVLSVIIDNSKEHPIGGISRGFLSDLTAGTNGGGVHRYQALMINVMLMTTIIFEIFRNLAFPEIADSWLVLLTGSAGVYMATKQIGEDAPTTNPGATPAGTAASPLPPDGHLG